MKSIPKWFRFHVGFIVNIYQFMCIYFHIFALKWKTLHWMLYLRPKNFFLHLLIFKNLNTRKALFSNKIKNYTKIRKKSCFGEKVVANKHFFFAALSGAEHEKKKMKQVKFIGIWIYTCAPNVAYFYWNYMIDANKQQ